jgi:hypothetical protein
MGRPRLEIGTFGDINTQLLTNGRWKARARFRDRDGVTREVKAVAATEAKAKAKLRGVLKERRRSHAGADDAVEMRRRIAAWQGGGSRLGPARGYDRLRIFDVLLATGARIGAPGTTSTAST